jgi:hypothetical protein
MAGHRLPSVLSPRLCLLPRPVPVYLLVSLLVVALSPKTPMPCRPIFYRNRRVIYLSCEIIHLYEVIQYTCATLRILLLHRAVASLKRRHTTPSTVSQGATRNAGTTPSNLPTPSPGHQFDCCEIVYIYHVSYICFGWQCNNQQTNNKWTKRALGAARGKDVVRGQRGSGVQPWCVVCDTLRYYF